VSLALERITGFFETNYLIPSLLYIGIAYATFWIDKNSAPARAGFAALSILFTIKLTNSVHSYLPQINY
jgi:hypothetical protein